MCLPFEVFFFAKFGIAMGGLRTIRNEGAKYQKLGVFLANYCTKHPIWAKLGVFLSEMVTDAWVIGRYKSDIE